MDLLKERITIYYRNQCGKLYIIGVSVGVNRPVIISYVIESSNL